MDLPPWGRGGGDGVADFQMRNFVFFVFFLSVLKLIPGCCKMFWSTFSRDFRANRPQFAPSTTQNTYGFLRKCLGSGFRGGRLGGQTAFLGVENVIFRILGGGVGFGSGVILGRFRVRGDVKQCVWGWFWVRLVCFL